MSWVFKMIINVNVSPNSKENKLIKTDDKNYIAKIGESADKNKANIALLKMLSKEFNVSYKKIKIKNPRSRKKVIEIDL